MTERTGPARYEIELGGHASERVLGPLIDGFSVELTEAGTTRLVGHVRDSSHLNGLLAHYTSLNIEVVALRRLDEHTSTPPQRETSNRDPQGELS